MLMLLPVVPVGSSGCFIASHGHIDNLCPNSSVCVNAKCKCSSDTYQNGPDGSFSTVCINEKPTCPDTNWIFYDNRCYRVYPEEFRDYIMDNKPPIAADYCCGKYSAYLATIHTQEDNDFLMLLGLTRSRRWIGHHFQKAEARWVDNSTVDFLNFGYTNANLTSDYCTYMDEVGYWRQSDCFNFDVTDVTCERAARCKSLPVVVNGSYSSTFVADVGSTYIYSCVAGYILAESHSGAVTCLEVERESLWTPPPMCNSLLVDIYELYTGVTLYGLQLSTVGTASDGLCAVECYNHIDCSVFVYNPMIHECVTFSNKSESAETGLVSLPNHEIWIHKYDYCGPVPHVQHATYNVTGTGPGSKVKYQCQGHYRIDRMTSDTLTCNDQARWDQDKLPVCVSRFERVNGYFPAGYKNGKVVYRTYSIADCELACMEETQFHCVRCAYYSGVCYLFDVPQTGNRGDYNLLDTDDFVSNCVSSELIDADLEEFDLWYHQTVEIGDGDLMTYTDGQSAELCAQACIYNNCTFFTYHWLNLTCAVFGSAIPTTTEMPSDPNSHVYIRRYGCVAPPTVANARVDIILQQVPGTYSIGDQVQVECLVPGEERVNNHDGLMVCQKTEKWSTPPACRNLCPNGWYMKEYTCYKLYVSVPRTFWDAYKVCHTEDAGLVNLETVTELQSSVADVWNWTGAISDSFWLGAYTDLSEWKWSERLADDVLGVLPSLSDPIHSDRLGAAVQFPSGTVTEAPVTDLKPFICERAAAKLVCPPGWEKYQNQCLKVFNSVLMNYTDAITACETEGSTIASVPMVFKADVIGDLVTAAGESKAYVGLYKPINGMYKLEDGARILHKYLFTQESSLTSELCGTLQTNFDYLTSDCATELAYVCQKSLDEVGLPTDFSSLPCSTDNFCNDTNLVCSRWKDGSTFLPPRCVGIACPPPWVYINGRCYKYNRKFRTFSEAFLDCVEDDSEVFIPNNIKENYDVFFWLRSLNTQVKSSAVHIGIEKVMGPTHIAMDSRKTPSFTRTTSSSSNYVLGVYDKYQGTWAGIASDDSCTTVM
ncbi:uncharacterized protein [Argopecten irradians]|uniref:uncharacterized protein n=1 Tax=Argopecten irradians TaxID=31199 RepID=UPI00370FF85C